MENTQLFLRDARLRVMLLLGLGVAIVAAILGQTAFAMGVVAGIPLGVFNYWLMWDAVQKGEAGAKNANAVFLGRSLLRMGVSVAALVVAAQISIPAIFGVMVGLFLHLLTYTGDVFRLLKG